LNVVPIAEARVQTKRASRYLVQLCRHAQQMRRLRHLPPARRVADAAAPGVDHVDYSDTVGTVRFPDGQLRMRASADTLSLRVEAADDDALRRLQDGVAARLNKIGRRDHLTTTWHRMETPVPLVNTHSTEPVAEPGTRKRRWLRRLTVMGLVAGGALIVALHLGVGGAAVAATPWTEWVGGGLLVIILAKLVFIASHVILGRFAFRRGKAIHARWKLRQSPREPSRVRRAHDRS
jgi:hypothetical protein